MKYIEDKDLKTPFLEPGIYRHYKGNVYEVIGVALDTETHEPMVVYKPQHEIPIDFWVRPYHMFIEDVMVDGKKIPRFEKI